METSPLNRDNRQDTISQVDSLGLADYQHKHICHFVSDIDIDKDELTINTNNDEEDPLIW